MLKNQKLRIVYLLKKNGFQKNDIFTKIMRKKIAIIMGGFSSESEVSLKSGEVVYKNLCKKKYDAFRIHILKDKWVYISNDGSQLKVNTNDFSIILNGEMIHFDCIFNAIHGAPGEDGFMQAYFKLIGIPQTSCGMYQAALTFNKKDCLNVLKAYGIPIAKSYCISSEEKIEVSKIISQVNLPCIVKPNCGGSSFGVSKVVNADELEKSIVSAFKYDSDVIIEEFLDGIEVSVGVLDYKGKIKVLPITEIISENSFFDYEAKYLGKSIEITPAKISKLQEKNVIKIAEKIYKILKMSGFSRSEFIFKNNTPYFLEMNTVPGLTKESIFPKQALAAGICLSDLLSNAIEMAIIKNV